MADRVMVRNAADRKQIKHASRKQRERRNAQLKDLREILQLPGGRRLMWRLLEHTGVFRSVSQYGDQAVSYWSGIQDVGHFIMGEITEANEEAFFAMMREAQQARTRDGVESEAVRTPKADEVKDDSDAETTDKED